MRQLSYQRTEDRLSDHRPVSASYMIEVEVLSLIKLQRALTFTDAEIETYGIIAPVSFLVFTPLESLVLDKAIF